MKAMILAAGRGERMRPLTDHTPKPLLEVAGMPLIGHHLKRLAAAGFREIVINISHLAEAIESRLGHGADYGVNIHYSREEPPALETGGGIANALPLLGNSPFLVVNGDIWSDYPLHHLRWLKTDQAHLILVDNPTHHPAGDFNLNGPRVVNLETQSSQPSFTYSGIAVFHPRFFKACPSGAFPLGPLLRETVDKTVVMGEYYNGRWCDVGTPQRLKALSELLDSRP